MMAQNETHVSDEDALPDRSDARTWNEDGDDMVNQAQIRTTYATTRCALMQSQFEFQWLLQDLLSKRRRGKTAADPTGGIRKTLERQRKMLRKHLHELTRIGQQAKAFPGLLERAIEDAHRLFDEKG
jgi:hypothetical protein